MLVRMGNNTISHSFQVGTQNSKTLWKTFCHFLTKQSTLLPYAVTLFDIYPKEQKNHVHTKTWTDIFIAVLFMLAGIQEQPRHPLAGKWIIKCGTPKQWQKEMQYALPSHEKKTFNRILLSERSQSEQTSLWFQQLVKTKLQRK